MGARKGGGCKRRPSPSPPGKSKKNQKGSKKMLKKFKPAKGPHHMLCEEVSPQKAPMLCVKFSPRKAPLLSVNFVPKKAPMLSAVMLPTGPRPANAILWLASHNFIQVQGVRLTLAHLPQATGIFCGRLEAALLVAHWATGYYSTY